MMKRFETGTLGGGCFWCMEAIYQLLDGISQVKSGYAGGHFVNPTYEQVCSGRTGHAEVVQITFDSSIISYEDLLDVFFTVHDPTTLNRQGADVGTQYRSAIFYGNEEQRQFAESKISDIEQQEIWNQPIVTEVAELHEFYPAKTYHDDYFRRNPTQPYCQAVVAPKVGGFRKKHLDRLKRDLGT
jgi:peptide-methionine (S)-S-oxide reductase